MGVFRLLLAVCVLVGHAKPTTGLNWLPATTAVESFFVISGFYMQLILAEKYTPRALGPEWKWNFYLARYARLFPCYFACLVLTCAVTLGWLLISGRAVQPVASWNDLSNLEPSLRNILLWLGLILANLTIFLQDFGAVLAVRDGQAMFVLDRYQTEIYIWFALAIPQAWSLAVELLFYLLAPFLLTASDRRLLTFFVLALAAKLLSIGLVGGDLPYQLLPFVLANFLAGALACRHRATLGRLLGRRTALVAFPSMLLFVLALPASLTDAQYSLVAVVLTALVVPALFEAMKNNALDAFIGELSYPFYIFHLLCLTAIASGARRFAAIGDTWILLAALVATLAVSYIVVKLEFRFLEPWRQRLAKEPFRAVVPGHYYRKVNI